MENLKAQFESVAVSKEKQAFWGKTLERLDQVTDKLGKRIDNGIKETITAFLLNKFPTLSSCEGHVEERFGKMIKLTPYIDVGFEEPSHRFIGEAEIKNRIAASLGIRADEIEENDIADKAFWDYIHEHDIPETTEYLASRTKNEELRKSVLTSLYSFYEDRQPEEERKLIVAGIGPSGLFRVTFQAENPEPIAEVDLEKYKQELLTEQQEMTTFGQFLKAQFFNS